MAQRPPKSATKVARSIRTFCHEMDISISYGNELIASKVVDSVKLVDKI